MSRTRRRWRVVSGSLALAAGFLFAAVILNIAFAHNPQGAALAIFAIAVALEAARLGIRRPMSRNGARSRPMPVDYGT